jgi:hypothetical protein
VIVPQTSVNDEFAKEETIENLDDCYLLNEEEQNGAFQLSLADQIVY